MKKDYVTVKDLPELEAAYQKAVDAGKKQFEFNGNPLLTAYAKYLIEHLNNLKKQHDMDRQRAK